MDALAIDGIGSGIGNAPDARARTVALYAPSKTFNLAGLIGNYHIIYNDYLRERVDKESSLSHYNDMNVLSMHALIGAYSKNGEAWLSELLEVLGENVRYGCDFIREHFEGMAGLFMGSGICA